MNRRGFFAALSVLIVSLMALWTTPAHAGPRPPAGAVKGVVYDSLRQPIVGARVAIVDSAGRAVASTPSLRNGTFAFRELRPGNYTVTARFAVGSRILQGRAAVVVVDGQITNVRIVLQ